jgi:hypothetical protein
MLSRKEGNFDPIGGFCEFASNFTYLGLYNDFRAIPRWFPHRSTDGMAAKKYGMAGRPPSRTSIFDRTSPDCPETEKSRFPRRESGNEAAFRPGRTDSIDSVSDVTGGTENECLAKISASTSARQTCSFT